MVFKPLGYLFNRNSARMSTITPETISEWSTQISKDPTLAFAATVVGNVSVTDTLIKRDHKDFFSRDIYNTLVEPQGSPITNQKSSGRCWLFAATNLFRIGVMREYNLEKFQLSQSYLFFYDKLEKANFFLEQIIDTAKEDIDSRIVQHLLTDPISDGGQFGMLANVVKKYGLVPHNVFPDNANAIKSAEVNQMVTTLLRQYAQELREAVAAGKDPKPLQTKQMKTVHQLIVLFLGQPPGPNDEIVWDYVDKDKKVGSVTTTPLKFYKDVVDFDIEDAVSLLNDPRNEYNKPIHVERLGNVSGAPEVTYLNADIDLLATKAIERLKNNQPVFFGTHTPIYHHNASGIIDTELWDYKSLGFDPKQQKADRLRFHQSLMTHAMLFVGVHLDDDGKPLRWKVENSWGEDKGLKGYYSMSHDFFKEYVYQIVVLKDEIPDHSKHLDEEPIHLPPWDPCGALAN